MIPLGVYMFFGSAIECTTLVSKFGYDRVRLPALLGLGGIIVASVIPVLWPVCGEAYPDDCLLGPLGWPLAASGLAMFACFAWQFRAYEPGRQFLQQSVLAGWIAVYFGLGFSFAIALRQIGPDSWGLFLVVGVIVTTKFSDAGAYFAGRLFGRTKLCPNVSPGKTVEGLVGGFLISAIAAWIYFVVFGQPIFNLKPTNMDFVGIVLLSMLLTLAGLAGDLLQSLFKRELKCKDSSRMLPGLGGLWDVTDSLIPAMVVAYLAVLAEAVVGPLQL